MPTTFLSQTFEGNTFILDGSRFKDCRFVRCELIYRGEDGAFFDGCTFVECTWTFGGPAENALIFLADLYRGLGEEGRDLVESIFTGIRSGTVKRTKAATPVAPALAGERLRAAG
jgi:hypothetical protein